jgi:glyoxylase-like metal-dependent hydrolase (beta-lactamase superfamily II)
MRVKRWMWIVLGVVAVLLVAEHFLFETAAEPSGTYVIDVEALHRAATASGPLPERIEVEKVGDFAFPGKIVVAGDPFGTRPMVLLAHRVLWHDNRSLIIDTAMSPAAAKSIPGSKMDEAAFGRVEAAMKKADMIVFTHEHPDHVGGLSSAPDFASIAKKVRMTREQLNGPKLERADFPPGGLAQLTPLDYNGLFALAPGVVLQKAPGHSVGSQLVYVELANGTRFLFVGDIAWTYDNITRQIGRPGIAKLLMKEDRPAVAAQLRALAALPPDIHIVVAHDPVALAKDLKAGLYTQGFNVP